MGSVVMVGCIDGCREVLGVDVGMPDGAWDCAIASSTTKSDAVAAAVIDSISHSSADATYGGIV